MSSTSSGRVGRTFAILAAAALLMLAACSPGAGPRYPGSDRPLRPVAQPGNVAAADIAFARAARDNGPAAAFRSFAAPGALVHLAGGPVAVDAWLTRAPDTQDWAPRAVWSSCDGSLAVSLGRTQSTAGLVGSYVTAWERRDDGSYRSTYHASVLDDPQPPPRRVQEVPVGPDVIVVPGLDAIDGKAADCARGLATPAPPEPVLAAETRQQAAFAQDRTLAWRWEQGPQGGRVVVTYLRGGRWEDALDFAIPPATGR